MVTWGLEPIPGGGIYHFSILPINRTQSHGFKVKEDGNVISFFLYQGRGHRWEKYPAIFPVCAMEEEWFFLKELMVLEPVSPRSRSHQVIFS